MTVALGSLGLVATWPVGAAWPIPFPGDPPVPCTFELHDTADPGWLMTPSRGTESATGTMTCTGQLKGAQLRGAPGPFTTHSIYDSAEVAGGNTCALAAGRGTWDVKLPTADGGLLDLSGSFTWVGTQVGRMDGDLGRLPVTLGYGAYPDPGHTGEDCVTKPARHFGTIGQGTLGYATPV